MDFAMTFSYMCECFPIMFSAITLLSPSPFHGSSQRALHVLPRPFIFLHHVKHVILRASICFTKVSVHLSFRVSSHTEFLRGIAFLRLTSDNRNIIWAMYGILNLPAVWGSQHAVILRCNQPKLHWHIFRSFCSHWVSKVHCVCLHHSTSQVRLEMLPVPTAPRGELLPYGIITVLFSLGSTPSDRHWLHLLPAPAEILLHGPPQGILRIP